MRDDSTARTVAAIEQHQKLQQSLIERLVQFLIAVLQQVRGQKLTAAEQHVVVANLVQTVERGANVSTELAQAYVNQALVTIGEKPAPTNRTSTPDSAPDPIADPSPASLDEAEVERRWTEIVDDLQDDTSDAAWEKAIADAERIAQETLDDTSQRSRARALAASGAKLFRRVIHPELAKGGTCGLCVAASHRLYHIADLKPIHEGCHCTVTPATDENDPGREINDADLQLVYDEAGTTDGRTLKQVRVTADDTGDLTVVQGRKKNGKASTQATGDSAPIAAFDGALSARSDKWLRHQIALTEGLKDSEWRTKQLRRLKAELQSRH